MVGREDKSVTTSKILGVFLRIVRKWFKKFNQCYTFSLYIPKVYTSYHHQLRKKYSKLYSETFIHLAFYCATQKFLGHCTRLQILFLFFLLLCFYCCCLAFGFRKQSQLFCKIFEGFWSHLFEKGGGR